MIERLTSDDCHLAHRGLEQLPHGALPLDRSKITCLVSTHRELLTTTANQEERVRLLDLTTHLLAACAGLAMLGGDLDTLFGLAITDIWLSRNGYLLLPEPLELVWLLDLFAVTPKPEAAPSVLLLDAVWAWARHNIVEAASGITLAEWSGHTDEREFLACSLACPLTSECWATRPA